MTELANPEAEWSVAASLLHHPEMIAEVVGTQLEASDFLRADARALYEAAVESYYADQPVEPLSIAERLRTTLAESWDVKPELVAGELLHRISLRDMSANVTDHAGIVKKLSSGRQLLAVIDTATASLVQGQLTPEQVAATMSTDALAITSGTARRAELFSWMDTGRDYARYLQRQRLAREKGIELAVYTGFPFIDDFTKGIAPTELCFIAGPPGAGKSIVGWKCAEGFAARQMKKAEEHRIATLIVSMEMGLVPSSTRLAQSLTGIDGMRLREGQVTQAEYNLLLREWKARDGLPLLFNYASNFRLSQLRALIVEAIRRHNVGFVVIDHFRQIDPDKPIKDANDRDEVKVRFLKESIAKDLNVAVMCLAHTLKMGRASEGNPVPRMADLRGSGQIAANADLIGMLHKPEKNASEEEQLSLGLKPTDAEMLWVKCRHTQEGVGHFTLDPANMEMRAR